MEPATVVRQEIFDATPGEVWDALSTAERLSQWFGEEIHGEVRPGEVLRSKAPDGTERRAVVDHVEPERRIAFRWLPTTEDPSSRVEIEIVQTPDGTAVRVLERRFEAATSLEPRIGFRPLAKV